MFFSIDRLSERYNPLFMSFKKRKTLLSYGTRDITGEILVKVDDFEVMEDLCYSTDHLWISIKNGKAKIGMTDFAQKQLRDIVFVELPSVGDSFDAKDLMGTVESVKAVSDILCPLSGIIDEINEEIESSPELINEEPYENGWLLILSPTNLEEELGELMDFEKAVEFHKKLVEEA